MIFEVSKEICELIVRTKLSPPLCMGRLRLDTKITGGDPRDYFYIGIVSQTEMTAHLKKLEDAAIEKSQCQIDPAPSPAAASPIPISQT